MVVFTKFDGQIINEYVNLTDSNIEDKWEKARDNAEHTFQGVYLPKVMDAKNPPKAFVRLEGENGQHFSFIIGIILSELQIWICQRRTVQN